MTEGRQNHDFAPDDFAHDLLSGIITACENGVYKTKTEKATASRNNEAAVFCETKPNDGHGQNRKPSFFHGKMDGLVRCRLGNETWF